MTNTQQAASGVRPWMIAVGLAVIAVVLAVAYTAATPTPGTDHRPGMRSAELAGFACSQLRDGTSEAAVTAWLTEQASGDVLRDTLRRVESRCPDLLN